MVDARTQMGGRSLTQLNDFTARQLGRSEFVRPVVIEAGAGTGKTAVLVARIVHWCLGPGWDKAAECLQLSHDHVSTEAIAEKVSSGVVAITFTDAAAVEMQRRVATTLRGVHRDDEPEWLESHELGLPRGSLVERSAALASCGDRLRVQTIHGFCSNLLREYALDVGLHPRFSIDADGRVLRGLALDLVGRHFDQLYGDQADPDAILLASSGFGPSAIAQDLHWLAAQAVRPEELPEDPCESARFLAWREPILKALKGVRVILQPAAAEALATRKPNDRNSKGLVLAAEVAAQLEAAVQQFESVDGLGELFAEEGIATQFLDTKAYDWAKGAITKTELGLLHGHEVALESACAELIPAIKSLRGFDPDVLRAGTRLMRRMLGEMRDEMQRLGLQSFNGLLRDARFLLRERDEVAVRVRESIDQLLIDEFQDTDVGQCELVARLALDPLATVHRPGLFLVGDPKQSIYGWRGADLSAYAGFVAQVCEAGGKLAELQVNFRSVAPILDEVERCVRPVMEFEEGRQPRFQALSPSPKAKDKEGFCQHGHRAVEHWVSWAHESDKGKVGAKTTADHAREVEARAIAQDLAELHQEGSLSFAGAALLMRSTTGLDVYLNALREAGVPYQVERDRNYYRRREVVDAASLVRAIVDPHDQLAWVAALRAPIVGVPDAAWLPLWRRRFPELCGQLRTPNQKELLIELRQMVSEVAIEVGVSGAVGVARIPDWEHALIAAVDQLATLRQSFRVDPADEFVGRLRAAFQHEATEAARFLGAHRLANLERFYRRLTEALASEEGGPQGVLRVLRIAVAAEEDESDSPPGDDSLDAVRVMTIHKAKGLTFEHVYLADIHGGSSGGRGLPRCAVSERLGVLEFCLFGMPTLGWHRIAKEEELISEAELVRLLYVALTRPQSRLVVCGKRAMPDAGGRIAGLEGLLRERMSEGAVLAGLFGERRGEEIEHLDAYGCLWRIPFLIDEQRIRLEPSMYKSLSVPLALKQMKQIDQHQEAARGQQQRERIRTASRESGHEEFRFVEAGGAGTEDDSWAAQGALDPELSRAVGTAVHRALELLDLDADPVSALRDQIDTLANSVRGFVPRARLNEVVAQARTMLEEADRRGILYELFGRHEQIIGREIPILLPDEEIGGAIVGTLDLLYRDPATGQLVVADFKTDAVRSEEDLEAKTAHYRGQGRVYQDAVARMFPEEEPPAFELWFLTANRIVR
ncbi:MAG: UvrD-helicase domain-containing protein [Planctomycetes bacterium]|nr:UvrD-helicase domain-containing protein [Planctomycetota bacterium]